MFDVKNAPQELIIDFAESRVMDQSAIEIINKNAAQYQRAGKTVYFWHLSKDCVRLIEKAEELCVVNVLEDPDYFVAIDEHQKPLTPEAAWFIKTISKKSSSTSNLQKTVLIKL